MPAYFSFGYGLCLSALTLLSIYGAIAFPSGIPLNFPLPFGETLIGYGEMLLYLLALPGLIVVPMLLGIALRDTRNLPRESQGRRWAWIGLILGLCSIVIFIALAQNHLAVPANAEPAPRLHS